MNTLEKWREIQEDKTYWENEKRKKAQDKRKTNARNATS